MAPLLGGGGTRNIVRAIVEEGQLDFFRSCDSNGRQPVISVRRWPRILVCPGRVFDGTGSDDLNPEFGLGVGRVVGESLCQLKTTVAGADPKLRLGVAGSSRSGAPDRYFSRTGCRQVVAERGRPCATGARRHGQRGAASSTQCRTGTSDAVSRCSWHPTFAVAMQLGLPACKASILFPSNCCERVG